MDGYEETAAVAAAVGPTLPTIPTPAKAFEPAAAPLGGGKRPGQGPPPPAATIVIHPTVSPEAIVIPIVSCIIGFPLLALLVICCLRRRAKLARERARRRPGSCSTDQGALGLIRFSPIHRLVSGSAPGPVRAVSLRASSGERPLTLDTVLEDPDLEMTTDGDQVTTPDSAS